MKIIAIVISSLLLTTNTCKKKSKDPTNKQTVQEPVKEFVVNSQTTTEPAKETSSSEPQKVEDVKVSPPLETSQNNANAKQDNGIVAEYEANSRGMFLKVKFTNGQILVFKDRNNSGKSELIKLSKAQLDELNKLLGAIRPEKLETMKAPTQARLYDGAAHANMIITSKGKTYSCPGFDHGRPPAGIEKFVQKLLSYTENN